MTYYDAFSPAITRGYSSFSEETVVSPSEVTEPTEARIEAAKPAIEDETPQTKLKSIETTTEPGSASDEGPLDMNAPDSDAEGDLPAPADDENGASILDAGWKIRWNPKFDRTI